MKKFLIVVASLVVLFSPGCKQKSDNDSGNLLSLMLLPQLFSPSGKLDSTFGSNGMAQINPTAGQDDYLCSIGRQSDGKIIAAGSNYVRTPSYSSNIILARFNGDGTIDTSFGLSGTGIVITDVPLSTYDSADGMVIQGDDKIIIAGWYSGPTSADILVARYNADGTIDDAFGTDSGMTKTNLPGNKSDFSSAVALDGNGKIVVAGSSNDIPVVLRYTSNGILDTSTFHSPDGYIMTTLCLSVRAMAVQSDNKIVIAGRTYQDAALVRIDSNGAIDTSFNTTGAVVEDFHSGDDYFSDVAVQPDGKIVAVGTGEYDGDDDIIIRRYNSNGSVDPAFNYGQWCYAGVIGKNDNGKAVQIQSDGKIIVGGQAYYNKTDMPSCVILRINSDGSPDTSFGSKSFLQKSIGTLSSTVTDLLILPDGRILAAAEWDANTDDSAYSLLSIVP